MDDQGNGKLDTNILDRVEITGGFNPFGLLQLHNGRVPILRRDSAKEKKQKKCVEYKHYSNSRYSVSTLYVWCGGRLWRVRLTRQDRLGQILVPLLFLLLPLLNLVHGILGQLLPEHPLNDVLLPSSLVANRDQDAAGNVARYGTAEDDCRQSSWSVFGPDSPRAATQGNLED